MNIVINPWFIVDSLLTKVVILIGSSIILLNLYMFLTMEEFRVQVSVVMKKQAELPKVKRFERTTTATEESQ